MVKNRISDDQLKFHPHSFADPDGRLFWLDGRLCRAISHEKTPFFAGLFNDGTMSELINRGLLVGSEPTDLVLDGYGMVLRHTCVPFVSYPNEWCPAMLKDAALAYLDLLKELIPRNLTLKDTHPWNILFDGTRPVYVDLTSITRLTAESNSPDYNKFCRYYLYPLVLMARGHERIVRYLLPDYEGILPSDFVLFTRSTSVGEWLTSGVKSRLRSRVPQRYRKLLRNVTSFMQLGRQNKTTTAVARLERLHGIRGQIESVAVSGTPQKYPDYLNSQDEQYLLQLVSQLRPESILGVGAKTLWYSTLASRSGSTVVVFDKDSEYITKLYCEGRSKNLKVLPLVMDFTDPTPSRGLSSHLSIAAAERFQCDLVLALPLLQPLVFQRYLRVDQLVGGLSQFAKQWLIIHHISPDNQDLRNAGSEQFSQYAIENITEALLKRFRKVTQLKLHSENQNLLLCEK
jgi:hypothetical protein